MDKNILKIVNLSKNKQEIIHEFKYNLGKKNSLKDCIIDVIHNPNEKNNIFREKLLSEGYSIIKIKEVIRNYDFDNLNFIEIYRNINNCNILNDINENCKIDEDDISKLSLVQIHSLIKEFKNIKILKKPCILNKLLKQEKYLSLRS